METIVSNSMLQTQNENITDIPKTRFEREMTEVLLNFREECFDLAQQTIDFGQPLDESGRFKSPAPDLSAVVEINTDVQDINVSIPKSINVEEVLATTPAIPKVPIQKISIYEISVPQSVEIEKVDLAPCETALVSSSFPIISFEGVKIEENKLSENARKTLDIKIPYRMNVLNVEKLTDESRVNTDAFVKSVNIDLPRIGYKTCDNKNRTYEYNIKVVANPLMESMLYEKIASLKTTIGSQKQTDVKKDVLKFADIRIPNVNISELHVQKSKVDVPPKCNVVSVELKKNTPGPRWSDIKIPQVPMADFN